MSIRSLVLGAFLATLATIPVSAGAQDSPGTRTCADVASTPSAGHADHGAEQESTPDTHEGHDMDEKETPEFDLAYIDMMIPHHESIIALAEAALPELTDPRLIEMAQNVIDTQTAENEQMHHLRTEWYGDAEPVSMEQMMEAMPGMGTDMAAMDQQMSAEWQVQTFCTAGNKDLAFIEQAIPHHQMAIDVSEDALERAEHEEVVQIATDVIAAQQAEIDELEAIRAELTGEATPAG